MRLISSLFSIRISRWAKLLAGLAFVGIGVAFTKQANLGLGPWDVLGDGLAHLIGIQLGTASIIIGAFVLLLWIPIREKPGIGTLTNLLLIGGFMNIALAVVRNASGVLLQSVWLTAGLLLIGLAAFCTSGVNSAQGRGMVLCWD
jgi:uncharacterized membrane protein YczE